MCIFKIQVTVPCPPNPIKAKKIAAMRKAKEDKMNNPPKVNGFSKLKKRLTCKLF
jgi:hypothetical protein